jgi:DNA-binding NarL/FixJ family response regulator
VAFVSRRRLDRDEPRLQFPENAQAREIALRRFDIDIETSLRDWFELMDLSPEKVAELLARKPRTRKISSEYQRKLGPTVARDSIDLTVREREVLSYAACGFSRGATAKVLNIGVDTAKGYRTNAVARLRARDTCHAVILALLCGDLDETILREHLLEAV